MLQEDDVAVSNVRIDLTRGRNNPLERLLRKSNNFFLGGWGRPDAVVVINYLLLT